MCCFMQISVLILRFFAAPQVFSELEYKQICVYVCAVTNFDFDVFARDI